MKDINKLPLIQIKILLRLWNNPNKMGFAEGREEGGSVKELSKKGLVEAAGKVGRRIRWRLVSSKLKEKDVALMRKLVRPMSLVYSLVFIADRDYLAARLLNFCGPTLYTQAAYHAQQCAEKYLKAILLQERGGFPKEHKLSRLRELCGETNEFFSQDEIIRLVDKFDLPEQVARYGPFATFDPLSKKEEGKFETRGVFVWQDTDIKDLDMLVYKIRKLIDYSGNEQANGLKAILDGDDRHQLVNGWKLKSFNIRDVLTSHNNYFK